MKYAAVAALVAVLLASLYALIVPSLHSFRNKPIKVGVLHSLTGTMSASALPVVDATLMAIEEINKSGGLLNRELEPIVVDGNLEENTYAHAAEKLIAKDQVSVIFGCWTSLCRKSLLPVIEKYNSLLVYPLQYEGLEHSPHILYAGAAPNQQIVPAIKWAVDNLGNRFFLVGSDYVFPHTAHAIIKDQVRALKGSIVGEEYLSLGSHDVKNIIEKIKISKPSVIINTINGDSNATFFKELFEAGISSEETPVLSFSLSESEIPAIGVKYLAGDYAAWNYFQSIDNEANKNFVSAFKERYGSERPVSDAMEAAYVGVYLWAQAVESCGSSDAPAVIHSLKEQSRSTPEGVVSVDAQTMHLWKTVRIGKINSQAQFDVVWTSDHPIRPKPYPPTRTEQEWDQFLQSLYKSWNQHWSNQSQHVNADR